MYPLNVHIEALITMAILITFILSIFTKNNLKRAGHDKWNLIIKKIHVFSLFGAFSMHTF